MNTRKPYLPSRKVLLGLILFIFLLTACGTQPAPPAAPTSPPTSPPTETPTPQSTLTPTPTVIPGPFEGQPTIPYPSDEVIQELGITAYQVVGEQYVALNEEGYVVAQAITNEKGEFTGWQRTLPFDVETGLVVPHPQETNPELVDLEKSDAPIPQFVNAMRMGGIEIDPQEVADNLQYQTITGADGKPYVIGAFNLDPDPNKKGETLEGPICIIFAKKNENGKYEWRPYTHGELANAAGITLGVSTSITEYKLFSPTLYEYNQIQLADAVWKIPYSPSHSLYPKEGVINNAPLNKAVNDFRRRYPSSKLMVAALVWGYYDNLPDWLLNGNYSKEQLKQMMVDYITQVMTPLRGKVDSWVVVNEPFIVPWNVANTGFWQKKLGPDYNWIIQAFMTAHDADPNAKLILNDYRIEIPGEKLYDPSHANKIFEIVKTLKEMGIPVEIGFQMHLYGSQLANSQTLNQLSENFRQNIRRYRDIGVEVNLTEWDIRMENVPGTSEERTMAQAEMYESLMTVALEEGVRSINFFGINDEESWLEDPAIGGPNAQYNDPTLKVNEHDRKPAWYAINQALINFLLLCCKDSV